MKLTDLTLDHAAQTCRLRASPVRDPRGKRSRIDPDLVARVRYSYWARGQSLASCSAALGLSQPGTYRILKFQRLAHL